VKQIQTAEETVCNFLVLFPHSEIICRVTVCVSRATAVADLSGTRAVSAIMAELRVLLKPAM